MHKRSRRNQKQHAKMLKRCLIRRKMGKPVFFTLTHSPVKYKGFSNRYDYKANLHSIIYKDVHFNNVKFQASIITRCNFRGAVLNGVDFFNSNLKQTSFKGAFLKNVVFFNCKFQGTDFTDAKFENVHFISSNLSAVNGIIFDNSNSEVEVYKSYPVVNLPPETEAAFLRTSSNPAVFTPRVLHVNSNRLNYWVLSLLIEEYGLDYLEQLSEWLNTQKIPNNLYTVHSYEILLEKIRKM